MKAVDVLESKYFIRAVEQAVDAIYGEETQAELATLVIEEDVDKREVLVVTPLALLRVRLDLERFHADTQGQRPVTIEVTPWDKAEPVGFAGQLYPEQDGNYSAHWELIGVELRTPTKRRSADQLIDFAREHLQRRLTSLVGRT